MGCSFVSGAYSKVSSVSGTVATCKRGCSDIEIDIAGKRARGVAVEEGSKEQICHRRTLG